MAKKKVIKKRGVKPGTKRGRYRKTKAKILKQIKVSKTEMPFTPAELSLCQQLEETITRFENRISNSIGRLNELMGKF